MVAAGAAGFGRTTPCCCGFHQGNLFLTELTILATGNPAFNSPWSYTGMPTISIPAGWSSEGLPLAIQLVGAPDEEAKLVAAAQSASRP